MLVVEGLVKRFGTRTVLDGLGLHVAAGEYVAIVGESGSGKSTLLNLIAGLEQPDSGSVAIDGANVATMDDEQRTLTRRAKVGFVFQSFHILPHLTVAQNVELPLVLLNVPSDESKSPNQALPVTVVVPPVWFHVPTPSMPTRKRPPTVTAPPDWLTVA